MKGLKSVNIWSVLTWTVFGIALAGIVVFFVQFVIAAVRENKAAKSRISEVHSLLDAAKNSRLQARQEAAEASPAVRDVWVEFDETLVDDLQAGRTRSTIEAEFFFNSHSLASPLFENRWIQALPGTLIAIGVGGTFFKLTFGLMGLDLTGDTDIDALQESVMTLLTTAGLSFSASGVGVLMSLIATGVLSNIQTRTARAINGLVSEIDSYFERYSAEFGIQRVDQNTREIAQSLNELHEKIGVEFQKSVQGLSSDMQNAIIGAINVALAPAMENLSKATSRQSGEVFDSLVGRFSEAFEGMGQSQATAMKSASQDLVESVTSLSSQVENTLERIEKTTADSSQATSSGISQMLAAAQDQAKQDRESQALASTAAREQAEADRAAYSEALSQLQTSSAESLARFRAEASEQTDVLQRQFGELAEKADDRQQSLEANIAHLAELTSRTQALMETSAKNMAASSADLKSVADGFSTTTRTVAGNLSDAVSSIQAISQQQSQSLRALDQHSSAISQITSHSSSAGEQLAAAAHEAKTAFDEMRQHQTEFLLGLGDSLDGAKTSLTQSIEQTAKKMAEWLAAYSDAVSSQTDERLNDWNKQSTEYASSMLQIAKSLEGVIDELEGVNKSGAYTRKAVVR